MAQGIESQIRRFENTAKHFETKGKREWAYAKNGKGEHYYSSAKDSFERSERNYAKAEALKATLDKKTDKAPEIAGSPADALKSVPLMAAGTTGIIETVKAVKDRETLWEGTSHVVSKSAESATNAVISSATAMVVGTLTGSLPLTIGVSVATGLISSELTDGIFDEVGECAANIVQGASDVVDDIALKLDNAAFAAKCFLWSWF